MINKFFEETLWIFNHPQPEIIPSYFVSGLMPAYYMNIKKVIFLDHHNCDEFFEKFKPKCIIVSKAFSLKIAELTKIAKQRGIIVISIFDDWNFDNQSRIKLNLPIAENSDYIISKTQYAANEIKKNTNLKSVVIPDPIRFQKNEVIKNINTPYKLCWFGMHTNHSTIVEELLNLEKTNLEIQLNIISNSFEEFNIFSNKFNLKNIKLKFSEWKNNSDKDIIKNDIVLLPYPKDNKRLVKSSNRIVESLNLGRFTILSNVKQFEEFKPYTFFGSLSDGLTWLADNKEKAYKITKAGQRYVSDKYSLKNICDIWIKLFSKLN